MLKVELPRETNGVVVAIVVVVQGEEPAVAGVDTTCAVIVMGVLREVTEGGEDAATDVEDSVVGTVEVGWGKNRQAGLAFQLFQQLYQVQERLFLKQQELLLLLKM